MPDVAYKFMQFVGMEYVILDKCYTWVICQESLPDGVKVSSENWIPAALAQKQFWYVQTILAAQTNLAIQC